MSTSRSVTPIPDPELARFARRGLWVLVATVVAFAVAGALSALGARPHHTTAAPTATGPFRIASDVPVSFGVIAIETVNKLPGLSKRSVASADHGIPGFVPAGKSELDLDVTLRNTTKQSIAYDPRAFGLQVGDARRTMVPVSASIRPGRLEPGATLDGTLRYIISAKRQPLRVLFKDRGRTTPIRIELGAPKDGARSARSRPAEPAKPGAPHDPTSAHGH